jgi:predicted ABC-type ATPase
VGEFAAAHGEYFNPDAFARKLVRTGKPAQEANAIAWKFGFEALQRAIARNGDFSFETTLGGNSIARELHRAIEAGMHVRIFYVGLASPDLHVTRVQARVARGGHDVPAATILERYPRSLANLTRFLGKAAQVHVFDNSVETAGGVPSPQLVLRMRGKRIFEPQLPNLMMQTPEWAKAIVAAALRVHLPTPPRRRK